MVKEVQLMSDLHTEDSTDPNFTPNSSYSTDDQIALLAFLLNLQYYYDLYQSMSYAEVYARIDEDIENLKTELYELTQTQTAKAIDSEVIALMDEYNIRHDWFGSNLGRRWLDFDLFKSSIDGALNQLRDDIKSKCLFAGAFALGNQMNVASNFRRAIKRLSDAVVNNFGLSRQKAEREILGFVFGYDTLYDWVCRKDARTCNVCRALAREAPKRIDEWPYDHPHGRCTLKPVSKEYSKEYIDYLENYA